VVNPARNESAHDVFCDAEMLQTRLICVGVKTYTGLKRIGFSKAYSTEGGRKNMNMPFTLSQLVEVFAT